MAKGAKREGRRGSGVRLATDSGGRRMGMVFGGKDELGMGSLGLDFVWGWCLEAFPIVAAREFFMADGRFLRGFLESARAEREWVVCLWVCSRRKRFLGRWRVEL